MERINNIIFANSSGTQEAKAINIFRLSGNDVLLHILKFIKFPKKIQDKIIEFNILINKEISNNISCNNYNNSYNNNNKNKKSNNYNENKISNKLYKIIKPRYAYYVKIINPFFNSELLQNKEYEDIKNIKTIDEAIFIFYKGPKSYTGEDMVELLVHGSKIIDYILTKLFILNGFSLAQKGEFTKRAFLNGKIDLIQAEAINNLIHSNSLISYQTSIENLQKRFTKKISKIKNLLFDTISFLEASLDYPEEELYDTPEIINNVYNLLQSSLEEVNYLLKNSSKIQIINNGLNIAIAGPTNTGKSSLFNLLLDEDRAIVSDIHGTTRDYIEGNINIKNFQIKLFDTPGIRESSDPIEQIGIKKVKKIFDEADIILFVLSPDREIKEENIDIFKNYKDKIIFLLNKFDLIENIENFYVKLNINIKVNEIKIEEIKNKFKPLNLLKTFESSNMYKYENFNNLIPNLKYIEENFNENLIIPISVLSSKDFTVHILNHFISKLFNFDEILNEPPYIQSKRELEFLIKLKNSLEKALELTKNNQYFDLIAEEISYSLRNLTELTGEDYNDTLYDNIFGKFCLGK